MAENIELGDKVKCIHTGFEGVAVARTKFINGCIQYNVAPQHKKGSEYQEEMGIDEGSLEIVESRNLEKPAYPYVSQDKDEDDEPPGGKSRSGIKQRGF